MKRFKKLLSVAIAVICVAGLMSGCNNSSSKEESSSKKVESTDNWNEIKDKGVLKIGLCPEYPPFESINKDGKIEGFDAELADEIGKELGLKVELVNTPWEGLISGLNNGNFDLIMSAMSPEEATQASEAVELSDAYYKLGDVMAVKSDNTSITKKEDLADKTVGYQTGSAAEQAVDKLEGMDIKVKAKNPYNRNSDAFAELENGRIDAVVVSYPYAVTQSKEDKKFKVVNDPIQEADLVAIAKKGNKELIAKYNEALKKIIENGKYKEIESKWLSVN